MANNKIQIKRSTSTAAIPALSNGELAFTQASNTLHIGLPDGSGSVRIGGAQYPGTLTANQALVADSTGSINEIRTANLVASKIYANGEHGTTGSVLSVNSAGGIFWAGAVTADPGGSDTHVQFNDGETLGGTAGFTFNKTSNNLSVANTITAGSFSGNGASVTSVNAVAINGNTASDLNTYADNKAANAYSNAMADTLSRNGSYTGNNTLGGTNTVISSNLFVTGTINRAPTITLGGDLTGSVTLTDLASGTLTASIAAGSVDLGTDTTGDYVATITSGNGISGSSSGAGGAATIAVVANSGLLANSSGVFVNANNGILANTSGVFVNANNGLLSNSSGVFVVGNTGVTSNSSGVFIGQPVATTDNVTFNDITINGNTVLGSSDADVVSFKGTVNTNFIPTTTETFNLGSATNRWNDLYLAGSTIYLGNAVISESGDGYITTSNLIVSISANLADVDISGNTVIGSGDTDVVGFKARANTSFVPASNGIFNLGTTGLRWGTLYSNTIETNLATISGDLSVGGNVYVTGNVVSLNVETLSVRDPLIQLASNNTTTDLLDVGFYGTYSDDGTTVRHSGLVRDATDGKFRLFANLVQAGLVSGTATTVDIADASFKIATLNTFVDTGAFVSNSSAVSIVSNSSVQVSITANTLTLSSPLLGNSGGTGLSSYTLEDILVANSTNGFRTLGLGTSGFVLQSNGTALVYDTLDGGTF